MLNEHMITEIPEDYGKDNPLTDASEKAIRKMVKKHPAVFAGERWDKYREKRDEVTKDCDKEEIEDRGEEASHEKTG